MGTCGKCRSTPITGINLGSGIEMPLIERFPKKEKPPQEDLGGLFQTAFN
jgi:hypothetical protein